MFYLRWWWRRRWWWNLCRIIPIATITIRLCLRLLHARFQRAASIPQAPLKPERLEFFDPVLGEYPLPVLAAVVHDKLAEALALFLWHVGMAIKLVILAELLETIVPRDGRRIHTKDKAHASQ